jgi:hypothetical protein
MLNRNDFYLVETEPADLCRGCHFREEDACPHSRVLPGWDCTPTSSRGFINTVFVHKTSLRGRLLRIVVRGLK